MKAYQTIAPTEYIFKALLKAAQLGWEAKKNESLQDCYESALIYIMNHGTISGVVIGNRNSSNYMSAALPLNSEWWSQGEHYLNGDKRRYEEIAQDFDGKLYKIHCY